MNLIQSISQALPDKFDKMIVLAAVFTMAWYKIVMLSLVVSWYTRSSLDSFVEVTREIFQA